MATCKWCGREYTKVHNRQMYCSDYCRKYARQEQVRINRRKYYQRYKKVMGEKQRSGLGSGFLSANRNPDFQLEFECIQKELIRLKISF